MKNIPYILIYSRLFCAILVPLLAFLVSNIGFLIVFIMFFAIITDIFDGIIARKFGIATERLRILDSNVDLIFWLSTIITLFVLHHHFMIANWLFISILILLELGCYLVSYLKFKRTVATHSILAKFWTITLLAFLIDLALNGSSDLVFKICLILGVISRIEIIIILISLKTWATDIPSLFAVGKLNRGEIIKRNKLFN